MRQVLRRGETALVRKAAQCSNSAFEALLDRNGSRLRMTVAKYIENSDDREDRDADAGHTRMRFTQHDASDQANEQNNQKGTHYPILNLWRVACHAKSASI